MAENSSLQERVSQIVKKRLGLRPDQRIDLDSRLNPDLGADSVDMTVIALDVEDAFDVQIEDELVQGLKTIRCFVDIVQNKLNVPQEP